MSCDRSQLHSLGAVESPGLPVTGCWACLHETCLRKRHFPPPTRTPRPPQFPSPCGSRGSREFHKGTEPSPTQSHKPRQPQEEGDGSSLAVLANIYGCSCQSPSPSWPHYPAWPQAHARIDESPRCPCTAGAGGIDGLQNLIPPPHPTPRSPVPAQSSSPRLWVPALRVRHSTR